MTFSLTPQLGDWFSVSFREAEGTRAAMLFVTLPDESGTLTYYRHDLHRNYDSNDLRTAMRLCFDLARQAWFLGEDKVDILRSYYLDEWVPRLEELDHG